MVENNKKIERLQKVMAEAGIASRRHCEELILDGQVKVNGSIVMELPCFVDPQHDTIIVSGKRLKYDKKVYYILHKPKKVVCTNADSEQRLRAMDLLKGVKERVYPVGRLDTDSKGLVIMTNDGELANQLTHPRYGVCKTYLVEADGWVSGDEMNKLKKGIHLEQGKASMESIKILSRNNKKTTLEVVLREGRNRQIRRMLVRLGHEVRELTRIRIGQIQLKGLGPGKYRELKPKEVESLQKLTAGGTKTAKRPTRKRVTRTSVQATVTPTKKKVAHKKSVKSDTKKTGKAVTKSKRVSKKTSRKLVSKKDVPPRRRKY